MSDLQGIDHSAQAKTACDHMHYKDIVKDLSARGSLPGLDAVKSLLRQLGNPQDGLPVIHVAGSNGKGSVCAFLESILRQAGCRVGRYLSPTITAYEERFQINGDYIKPEDLEILYDRVLEADRLSQDAGVRQATLFEIETAIAFLWFKERKVDFALIECGMGGREDATNVFDRPLLSIITSISFDHMQCLGSSLSQIAWHKAGIIKGGCPVVLSENDPEVREVVAREANKACAPLIMIGPEDYRVIEEKYDGSRFEYMGQTFHTGMIGRHQISNAVTAIEAARQMLTDRHIPRETQNQLMVRGIAGASWPGRLEIIGRSPLTYRDGAHNIGGIRALAAFVEKHFTNRRIIYIMGILSDKEVEKMVETLVPSADRFYVFTPNNHRGLAADRLAQIVRASGREAYITSDVNEAMRQARKDAGMEDVLVLCGSLSFMEEMVVEKG